MTLHWQEDSQDVELPLETEQRLIVLPGVSAALSQVAGIVNLSAVKPTLITVSKVYPPGAASSLQAAGGWDISNENGEFALRPKPGLAAGLYRFLLEVDRQPAATICRFCTCRR